ncbi:MAG: ATP-binding protein [Bacteroidales bacterium]
MKTLQKVKKHALIMLFISIMLFVFAFVLSIGIKRYNSPANVTDRLQKEISLAVSDLESEIEIISKQNLSDRNSFLRFLNRNYKNIFSEKGIEFLVYANDSLQYWTSNVYATSYVINTSGKLLNSEVVQRGSGYYLLLRRQVHDHVIIALQLLKYNYKYSNDYLPTGFNRRFSAPDNASIKLQPGKNQIYSPQGKFLFSISFNDTNELPVWAQYLNFTIYISSYLCLIAAIFLFYLNFTTGFNNKWIFFVVFGIVVFSIRAIQLSYRFPSELYQIYFFNPKYFASSEVLPSLGDLLINSILAIQLGYFAVKKHRIFSSGRFKYAKILYLAPSLILLVIIASLIVLTQTIIGLIMNSSISFQFGNVLGMQLTSHLGLLSIAVLLNFFLFIFYLSIKLFVGYFDGLKHFLLLTLLVTVVHVLVSIYYGVFDYIIVLILIVLFAVNFFVIKYYKNDKSWFSHLMPSLVVLAFMGTFLVEKAETTREHNRRGLLATQLSDARDNLAEYYFDEAAKSIENDTVLIDLLGRNKSNILQNDISDYIQTKYFSGYWNKYLIQITVCETDKMLSVQPGNLLTNCNEYFKGKISQFMQPVSVPGLYFLKQSIDAMYYLGEIKVDAKILKYNKITTIYIEISSNDIWKGLGYPELLIDNRNNKADNFSGYSYAFYNKGELVKNVGKFSYEVENINLLKQFPQGGFFISDSYDHLLNIVDSDTQIVISKEHGQISDWIAPFSYLFLLQLIILIVLNFSSGKLKKISVNIYTFRFRLQIILILVIVVSSILLVTVSLLFINKLNTNKNNEILNEKMNSILIDFETRFGSAYNLTNIPKNDLSEILRTLSNTYFSDVNIYDTKGILLASSRDQIFSEEMISAHLTFESSLQLILGRKTFFIQKESIGNYAFLSAYTPIRNNDNQLLGYLNLPYFARQEEIRREISGLITAFANIYLVMIVLTVLLALVLARYITKPLQQIGNQFSKFRIGNKNAKIDWERKDEIGRLVEEYNRMVDELEKSAELLAKSERESAWREMAKQVAHEIKNPLTPIKLSMQLLMRAWDDKTPDWDIRLKRFSQTLIMQIDTLSAIASEFSDFAQMPEPQIQTFDLIPLIRQAEALFYNQSFCRIEVESQLSKCFIKADPNQMLRVFNNLIKNALQSIPGERQGLLRITITHSARNCEIKFLDNGTGISTESQARIFSPNFTTKTAGMGLGLAMVKNIIDSISGRIWFETIPGKGTTFIILLPVENQEF